MDVKIQQEWKELLKEEFEKEYFKNIAGFLHKEKREGKTIYPPGSLIFNAFELTPPSKLKVVILGQDPYHGPNQAHGLSFSVPDGINPPPSLKNIYKEIESDLQIKLNKNGNLQEWARQGVFLLNAVLTVRASEPTSHSNIGWHIFTDSVIKAISDSKEGVVFMLWGNYARSKRDLIDKNRHLVLEAAHPSPLARGAFFGCRHFSQCNNYLISKGIAPIDWSL
ncbi:MAG: uracil-DNA glycosylase [Bacteroidales bacterium]|nr:uracil-DNA glycosylase [Bacteroidales bacterium]MBQ8034497.1 uracil-DNA glycosylase [Bacteroidales bacterium]